MHVDIVRRCFYYKDDEFAAEDRELKEMYEYHREGLGQEISEGKLFILGRTKGGHPLYVVRTHKSTSGFRAEWYMKYNIYALERAIAIAEQETDGEVENVCVVFDFGQYSAKLRPPLGLSKELQFCLRDHYPERVEYVVLIDTPFIFRAFWTLVKPFIDPNTKNKIVFVTGEKEKKDVVGNIVAAENAMPFMLPGGSWMSTLTSICIDYHLNRWWWRSRQHSFNASMHACSTCCALLLHTLLVGSSSETALLHVT